jgi:multiple sugar transport system substrate-binding protein
MGPSMTRKLSALLSAAMLVAAASACSSATSAAGGGDPTGPVTLTYGIWDPNQKPAMQQIVNAFEKLHPNITVDVELTPNADYWNKLQTEAASGTAPDVFWMSTTRIGLYAGQGQLLPLSDRSGFDNSPFPKTLNTIYTVNGKQYGMPKDYDTVGLWYNKKLFDAAGVKYPTASWTWQDVIDASKKLTDPGKGTWGIASPDWTQENLYNDIYQAGGWVISPDKKSSGFTDAKTLAGIQYALDFITKYKTSPTAQQMTDTDPSQLFASGKVAMFTDGDWDALTYKNAPGLRADVAPLPAGPQGKATVINGLANVIYARTAHAAAAWEFVKFLGGQQANAIQAASGAVIPAYHGLSDAWVKSMPAFHLQTFVDELDNAVPYPVSANTGPWATANQAVLDQIWAGKLSLSAGVQQLKSTTDAALAKG